MQVVASMEVAEYHLDGRMDDRVYFSMFLKASMSDTNIWPVKLISLF